MSPRSKEQFEEIREASQRKIFDASLELFGTKGYEATSIALIAKKAGISKGLIYNYFDSKEALLQAMVDDLVSVGDDIIEKIWSDDPAETLENLIQSIFEWFRQNQNLNRLLIGLSTQVGKFQFVHDMAKGKMDGYLIMLEELLQEIGFEDYQTEARILGTLFDGIALHHMLMKEDYPLDEVERMLIKKYCMKP